MQISVIIPTLNEEKNIEYLVPFVKEHGGNAIAEIIVVDGGSEDNTVEVAKHAGVIVLTSPVRSRAAQMNFGARHATGEILYFIHADVKLIQSFISDMKESVEEGFHSGCYRYVFDSPKAMLKINAYFTRFDRIMCRGGDQTLFVLKSTFETLGGFNEKFSIMEDYDFIIRLRKNFSFRIIPKNVIVSARKYETNTWLQVQAANLTIFIMFFLKQPPERMRALYKRMLRYRSV
jgi:rSAM/selenodomain-associated transferase 2